MRIKKFISIFITVSLIILGFVGNVCIADDMGTTINYNNFSAVDADGKCGSNVYYKYLDENSDGLYETMVFYGTGEMYSSSTWSGYFLDSDIASGIETVIVLDGVTSLGGSLFVYFENLSNISLPDSLVSIDSCVFKNCTKITSIVIPDSVISIEAEAFYGCSSLESIKLSESLSELGWSVFDNCTNLTEITIPESLKSLGYAFEGCTNLNVINMYHETYENLWVVGDGGYIELVDFGCPVNILHNSDDFDNDCCDMTCNKCSFTRTLEEGIIVIDPMVPATTTSTGLSEGSHCSVCGSVIVAQNVIPVLGSTPLPEDELSVANADGKCGENVYFKYSDEDGNGIIDSVTFFGYGDMYKYRDFWSNYNLDEIDNINKVVICDGITSVSIGAFDSHHGLIDVSLPNSLSSINMLAFSDCTSLTEIEIPNSVITIGNCAFEACTSLTNVIIPDSVEIIGSMAFIECTNLVDVVLPESVTEICEFSFSDCENLRNITLPESLTYIGYGSFMSCYNLREITIPKSVINIEVFAFSDCPNLECINIYHSTYDLNKDTLFYCDDVINLIHTYSNTCCDVSCSECSYIRDYEDGIIVIDPMVPSTETTTGLTEGAHCSVCGRIIRTQNTIPVITPTLTPSSETGVGGFVERLYRLALARIPSSTEKANLIAAINNGESGIEAAREIFFSNEFICSNINDNEYVVRLYLTFMERQPDQAAHHYWMGQLANGVSREEIFNVFAETNDWANLCQRYGVNARSVLTPTPAPTQAPTSHPTVVPTAAPTTAPTTAPTVVPTTSPTQAPTATPAPVPESGVGGFVERLYTIALSRPSDPNGKADWVNRVYTAGATGADIAQGFLFSPEFLGKDMTNEEFLDVLYRVFFDRPGDQGGVNYWLGQMAGGMDKQTVIWGFINSTEWANVCLRFGIASGGNGVANIQVEPSQGIIEFATRLYTTCLGRNADQNGLMDWARQLANRQISGSQAAAGFFTSGEFVSANYSNEEYINRLYLTFMGRPADQGGFDYWMSSIAQGASREDVFNGFAGSAEWAEICSSYGILK